MKILGIGPPACRTDYALGPFRSDRGHELRTLAAEGPADYVFGPHETAEEVVARVAADWAPDFLVCWLPENFPPPLTVEDCPIRTAAVVSDWNVYSAQLRANLGRYDVVLADRLGSQVLDARGANLKYFHPLYAHVPSLHRRLDGVERDIDVLFVGNLNHSIHVERGRLLERVASLGDDYRVAVAFGYFGEDYVRLLNRARIVFNFSVRHEMNLRCFEALACGALLFVEEGNLEATDHLQDRDEMVLYRPGNMVELLRHYLDTPDEAARIAAKGHAKAEGLAMENRLDALFDWLAEQPKRERRCPNPEEWEGLYAKVMQYSSALSEAQQGMARASVEEGLERFPGCAAFYVAEGCFCVEEMRNKGGEARKALFVRALDAFLKASRSAPDEAAVWLNLAFVCRQGRLLAKEVECLERALGAKGVGLGGLLLGAPEEAYYAAWRRAMATGDERVEMLWADAAMRLARLMLDAGQPEPAKTLSEKAMAWLPGMAAPYQTGARAAAMMDDFETAAALLEAGLPFTAFDAEHRVNLIHAWRAVGKAAEARALAAESARLFRACWGWDAQAEAFASMAAG